MWLARVHHNTAHTPKHHAPAPRMGTAAVAAAQMPMLHLYRNILKAAKHFPSRKRDRIIAEIKADFRAKKVQARTQAAGPLGLLCALRLHVHVAGNALSCSTATAVHSAGLARR